MVGLRRFELLTSPLSGVRSNRLSYRPSAPADGKLPKRREPAQTPSRLPRPAARRFPVMKGHEDDGMFFGSREALPTASVGAFVAILRKEVIQPQVPLRLPCYDFTPVADPTVAGCLLQAG